MTVEQQELQKYLRVELERMQRKVNALHQLDALFESDPNQFENLVRVSL